MIAFVAEDFEEGEGIYLAIDEPSDPQFDQPVKILGFPDALDGLGFDDSDDFINFDTFDFESRVGVEHRKGGPPGIESDSIIVTFIASTTGPSFTNHRTAKPMLYTEKPALWIVHLTPSRDLTGTGPLRLDNKTSPMPVVQVGDFIDGEEVTAIST